MAAGLAGAWLLAQPLTFSAVSNKYTPALCLQYARLHLAQHHRATAREWLLHAYELAPQDTQVLALMATWHRRQQRPEPAPPPATELASRPVQPPPAMAQPPAGAANSSEDATEASAWQKASQKAAEVFGIGQNVQQRLAEGQAVVSTPAKVGRLLKDAALLPVNPLKAIDVVKDVGSLLPKDKRQAAPGETGAITFDDQGMPVFGQPAPASSDARGGQPEEEAPRELLPQPETLPLLDVPMVYVQPVEAALDEARYALNEAERLAVRDTWLSLLELVQTDTLTPRGERQRAAQVIVEGLANVHIAQWRWLQAFPSTTLAAWRQKAREDAAKIDALLGMLWPAKANVAVPKWIQLDRAKLGWAAGQPDATRLRSLTTSGVDLINGEALFLLGELAKALESLDAVDGQTAQGYQRVVDRLVPLHALRAAAVLAERGLAISPFRPLKQSLRHIQIMQQRAEALVAEGNQFYNVKRYAEAATRYQRAVALLPDADTAYLRLADSYERLHRPADAFAAYQKAVAVTPGLMDSRLFAKKYRKLQRAAKNAGHSRPGGATHRAQ
jgi:tetratricopeptide (TPR) repeat protein